MTTRTHTWQGSGWKLPDGHRIFRNHDGSRWAIADDSGSFPDQTDDGVLWLDTSRPLLVDRDESFTPPREHIAIPLLTEASRQARTPTNAATILMLARMLKWTIEDKVNGHRYTVSGRL